MSEKAYPTLSAGGTLIALRTVIGERPEVLYCGPDIAGADGKTLEKLATQQHSPGGPDIPVRPSLHNELGTGQGVPPGLLAHRGGMDWAIDLALVRMEFQDADALTLHCRDPRLAIAAQHHLSLDPQTGVLTASTVLANEGADPLDIEWCASLCLPVDPRLERVLTFTGRWSEEFQTEDLAAHHGSLVRENRAGRTSHDCFPGLVVGSAATDEARGLAAGFHLAWSGNHRLRLDRHSDGRAILQMGDLPFPGEVRLEAGESYETPAMLACWTRDGFGDLSRRFHSHLADTILDQRTRGKPRPVHYNTWEAVYFAHDTATLVNLAERAAAVGAERFVLDDGWFGARRSPDAGLGDWWVSDEVYPEGLDPLVERVRALGMEFGLWFEPEMVNPDSDLFRAHPDWVLKVDGIPDVPFRGQHILDVTRKEVGDYLFEKIDHLVARHKIDYIKWDMNRDARFPASAGRAALHRQTRAVYALIDRLRNSHPKLEIESCASGGGRADFEILRRTDRLWTSDNNDARQRQHIQRGASWFFPLRVLGSHVGPATCHITGRKHPMGFRVASALFGHMGMELDLRAECDRDIATLREGIALYKRHRALLHEGHFYRLPAPSNVNAVGSVATDRREALFSYAVLDPHPQTLPARLQLAGLNPTTRYRLKLVWPLDMRAISTPSIMEAADLLGEGVVASGEVLMEYGIQPPLTFPDTCLVFHLEAQA